MTDKYKLPPTSAELCGTGRGVERHRRRFEFVCDDCRDFRSRQSARTRQKGGEDLVNRQRIYQRARARAQTALRHAHPAQYLALLTAELAQSWARGARPRVCRSLPAA